MAKSRYEEYKAISAEFDARRAEVQGELDQLEAQRADIEGRYEALVAALAPAADLHTLEDDRERADRRIDQLKRQLAYITKGKRQRLAELLPGVADYRDKRKLAKLQEHAETLAVLQKQKLEMLETIGKLGKIAREVDALHADHNALRTEAGEDMEPYYGTLQPVFDQAPALNGFEDAFQKVVGVPRWLAETAYNGRLPKGWDEQ